MKPSGIVSLGRRVFVALPISLEIAREAHDWRKKYPNLSIRWVEDKNLHVTIIPPWEERNVQAVIDALKILEGSVGIFDLAFHRVTYGPNSREPRLIRAEGESPEQIFALKRGVERTLLFTPEVRTFRLHLTLARFSSEDFQTFPIQKMSDEVSWHESVTSFVLMESHLSSSGADYEVLCSYHV